MTIYETTPKFTFVQRPLDVLPLIRLSLRCLEFRCTFEPDRCDTDELVHCEHPTFVALVKERTLADVVVG
jgi:hypothetical protein